MAAAAANGPGGADPGGFSRVLGGGFREFSRVPLARDRVRRGRPRSPGCGRGGFLRGFSATSGGRPGRVAADPDGGMDGSAGTGDSGAVEPVTELPGTGGGTRTGSGRGAAAGPRPWPIPPPSREGRSRAGAAASRVGPVGGRAEGRGEGARRGGVPVAGRSAPGVRRGGAELRRGTPTPGRVRTRRRAGPGQRKGPPEGPCGVAVCARRDSNP